MYFVTLYTDAISVMVEFSSTTSITISWILYDVTATEYIISYSNTDIDCFNISYDDTTVSIMSVELTDLEEGTEYSITVTAILSDDGGSASDTVTATTIAVG